MRRILLLAIILFILVLTPSTTFAQGMMGNWATSSSGQVADDHTAREEVEGKAMWDKLQTKQVACESLSDEDFGALGEYFMGLYIGNTERHAVMNQMMTNMMGKNGEEQMHVTLGKRSSGCDTNASLPLGNNFMPMMWMMGGGGIPMMGYGGWNGFGILGWLPMLLFLLILILGVVALLRYLGGSIKSGSKEKSTLDILKERYAKGEIDKKEFEEKKKDLG